jgi:hypothetical protein
MGGEDHGQIFDTHVWLVRHFLQGERLDYIVPGIFESSEGSDDT